MNLLQLKDMSLDQAEDGRVADLYATVQQHERNHQIVRDRRGVCPVG